MYNAVCSRNRVISSSVALLQIEKKKKKKFEAETIGGIYRSFANDFHAISRGHDARPIANCPSNFSFSFLKPVTRLLSPPRERRKAERYNRNFERFVIFTLTLILSRILHGNRDLENDLIREHSG